jgi:thiamine kinase-like enzyme
VARQDFANRPLHGDPHAGNVIAAASGRRWVDFEATCVGPLEWDLASLDAETAARFLDVNSSHLDLMRLVTSARVAIWCWARAEHREMRPHAEHHLGVARAALG